MNNIDYKVEKDRLILTIDISAAKVKAAGKTKKGTSLLVASTHGHVTLDSGFGLNLNLTKRIES